MKTLFSSRRQFARFITRIFSDELVQRARDSAKIFFGSAKETSEAIERTDIPDASWYRPITNNFGFGFAGADAFVFTDVVTKISDLGCSDHTFARFYFKVLFSKLREYFF